MRISSLMLCLMLSVVHASARAADPAPAPAEPATTAPATATPSATAPSPPAKKPAAAKPTKPGNASDEEEPAPKSAPRRFVPTDKGKADEDIPFPVDI